MAVQFVAQRSLHNARAAIDRCSSDRRRNNKPNCTASEKEAHMRSTNFAHGLTWHCVKGILKKTQCAMIFRFWTGCFCRLQNEQVLSAYLVAILHNQLQTPACDLILLLRCHSTPSIPPHLLLLLLLSDHSLPAS